MKDDKCLSKEGRGSMDHRVADVDGVELCVTRWYDNNTVNCLSTLYGCESTDFVKPMVGQREKTYSSGNDQVSFKRIMSTWEVST